MPAEDGKIIGEAVEQWGVISYAAKALGLETPPAFVISSSAGHIASHEHAQAAGFDAAMPKPVRLSAFEDTIEQNITISTVIYVTIAVLIPACRAVAIAGLTSGRAGSIIPTNPTKTRPRSIVSAITSRGNASRSR